jgi:hypothetical protein
MFRFTIRDVLWLMVLIGLGIALWMERSRSSVARRQLRGLVDVLEGVDVQAEVAPDHVTVTGPDFAAHSILGEPDPNQPPVVLDRKRVTPSIRP